MKKYKWERYPDLKKLPYKSPVICWRSKWEIVTKEDGTQEYILIFL